MTRPANSIDDAGAEHLALIEKVMAAARAVMARSMLPGGPDTFGPVFSALDELETAVTAPPSIPSETLAARVQLIEWCRLAMQGVQARPSRLNPGTMKSDPFGTLFGSLRALQYSVTGDVNYVS